MGTIRAIARIGCFFHLVSFRCLFMTEMCGYINVNHFVKNQVFQYCDKPFALT